MELNIQSVFFIIATFVTVSGFFFGGVSWMIFAKLDPIKEDIKSMKEDIKSIKTDLSNHITDTDKKIDKILSKLDNK